MKKSIILIFFIFLIYNVVNSQIVKYSNDYLSIGVSAKNISLGNSVTASVNDYSSGFYNPAGLSFLDTKYQISAMHSEFFGGIAKYDFAGFTYKINDSIGVSASFLRLGVDDIQNTLYIFDETGNIDYDKIELFSVADYAMFFSFGQKSRINGLSYGISAKIIFRNQAKFAKAYGFGLDAAVQYKVKKWNFGANLTNVTTSFTAWFYNIDEKMAEVFLETGNEIPKNSLEITLPILNTGVSRCFNFSKIVSLNTEIGVNFTFDGRRNALLSFNPVSIYPQTGLELSFKNAVFLRAGINNFQLIPDFRLNIEDDNYYVENSLNFMPSIGLGINYHNLLLDYAFTDLANQSIALYSHIFSLSYKF